MKTLIVHNHYRPAAPSGENVVVDQESAALTSRGHDVLLLLLLLLLLLQRHSKEIASCSPTRRASRPARVLWGGGSRRAIRTVAQAGQTYRNRFSAEEGIAQLLDIYRFAVEQPIKSTRRPSGAASQSGRLGSRATT